MSAKKLTAGRLAELLDLFGVDTSEWGKPGFASVERLLGTILKGEGNLEIREDGIVFVVRTARAFIRNDEGKVLVVGYEKNYGVDNSDLKIAKLPGGKIGHGEDPRSALQRELREEMNVMHGIDYDILSWHVETAPPVIRSLPNLPTERTHVIFHVQLNTSHPYIFLPRFDLQDNHGQKLLFKWISETEWKERQKAS